MDNLHPHWQTTEDEQPVAIRIKQPTNAVKTIAHIPSAKRSPAALLGIGVIIVVGFFAFGGMDLLPAQLSTDTIIIIADASVTPSQVNVQPGQKITWTNTSSIPQILTSKTLMDSTGKAFVTPAVFPNSEVSFVIPSSTPAGTYDFESNTSPAISGTIIVGPAGQAAQTSSALSIPSSMPLTTTSFASMPTSEASSMSSFPAAQTVTSSAVSTTSVAGIAVNPYTVANTFAGTVTKDITSAPAITTHRPVKQPESGTGLWFSVLAGLFALIVVMKKASLRA